MAREKKSFEKSLNELEEIVEKLEQGDMPLDESIKIFQKGVALSKELSKMLDEIEKKITILVENENGDIIEEDFIKD
ncbi:exodeoxyribonuclease VII small subunit [Acetivibrio clariflavus]|uniref:Exodeoxyribonuclease 7 small subunit n=1 Tax=Acetivibrio clariflavus (strain DSM 19732 / NBRC 101661 / EBR45) TaxID=720554 RepID=G8LW55_ACECE|nr:exodeoxyribonuclease VII small subunit [Acetivibrio clariflavus]AEV68659.1 Exodeoxyribonuclease VII small subunit [Acetivibrio clariflavus DSM 19732]